VFGLAWHKDASHEFRHVIGNNYLFKCSMRTSLWSKCVVRFNMHSASISLMRSVVAGLPEKKALTSKQRTCTPKLEVYQWKRMFRLVIKEITVLYCLAKTGE